MSKHYVLKESPTAQVVETVNDLGLQAAARQLGTSAATLSRWLRAQNYKIKRIYIKQEEKSA